MPRGLYEKNQIFVARLFLDISKSTMISDQPFIDSVIDFIDLVRKSCVQFLGKIVIVPKNGSNFSGRDRSAQYLLIGNRSEIEFYPRMIISLNVLKH